MKYQLPIGTDITPISLETGKTGITVKTTVLVDFEESDILKRTKREVAGELVDFLCLTLGENPSPYDSYLFKAGDAIDTKEINE